MKKTTWFLLTTLAIILVTTSGCEAIAGIFKAGVWTGIIFVVIIVAVVIFVVSKLFSKNK